MCRMSERRGSINVCVAIKPDFKELNQNQKSNTGKTCEQGNCTSL